MQRHLLRPGGIIIVVSPAARYGFATLEEGLREAGFVATHVRAAALPTSAAGPDSEAEGVPTAAATTAHEVVPDEWRVNPLRQPLAETLALAVAPEAQLAEAVGAVQVRAPAAVAAALGAASTSVSTAADPGLTSASTAALVEAVASGAAASFACPSACRHFEGFGGPARVPAPLHPSDAAADGPWGDGVSAAASALTTALYRAGGAGALRLVSASEAADMFPELGRPDYDILAAAFRAPLKPPAAVEEA